MTLTDLTIKLLLLFLPGIICYLTVDVLIVHRARKLHEIFLFTFVYGLISYLIYGFLKALCHLTITADEGLRIPPAHVMFFQSLCDKNCAIDVLEIGIVTFLSFVLGVAIGFAINKSWFHNLARYLKITSKFSQPNVWSFVLNAKEVKWATVRDIQNNLMFQGYIQAFSDVEEPAEIFLTRVSVYNEKTGEFLYEADTLYLAREKNNLTIEFPIVKE